MRGDKIETYKILSGLEDAQSNSEGIFQSEGDRPMEWAARGNCNSKNVE